MGQNFIMFFVFVGMKKYRREGVSKNEKKMRTLFMIDP